MTHRWMKFWPQDWANDQGLRLCSAAARGLWIDLLCFMHDATPYGHLCLNGMALPMADVAAIGRVPEKDALRLMVELERRGVFSRTDDGMIYSRRMVRDHEASEQGKKHVSKRWGGGPNEEPPNGGSWREPNTPPNRVPTATPNTLEAEADTEAEARKEEPKAAPLASAVAVALPAPGQDSSPDEQRKWLFSAGLAKLQAMSGLSGQRCRGVLGKALKAAEDSPAPVVQAICDLPQTGDPVPWLLTACRPKRYVSGWHQVMSEDRERASTGEEPDMWAEFRRAATGEDDPPPQRRTTSLRLAHG